MPSRVDLGGLEETSIGRFDKVSPARLSFYSFRSEIEVNGLVRLAFDQFFYAFSERQLLLDEPQLIGLRPQ